MGADIVAIAAISPLGEGEAAWSVGELDAPARETIVHDAALAAEGLRKPYAARAIFTADPSIDRATDLLLQTFDRLPLELPAGARLGVALGSSSGGMSSAEKLFDRLREGAEVEPALADAATYHAPFRALVDRLRARDVVITRASHVLTACSASTIALGLGTHWLDEGECDLVLAGGYDALTTFVAAGFEALGATTAAPPPRPFRLERDGMSLGEGAALFVLQRPDAGKRALARIDGFGIAGDAVHLTAPDREGGGLARSALAAMSMAGIGPDDVDLVSLHGTSTPFNDPMEAKAISRVLGSRAEVVPVHAAKASIGHTLGAAGALETALLVDALRRGIVPATAGSGELDPAASTTGRTQNERTSSLRRALKLSSAFGGANAALVVSAATTSPNRRPSAPTNARAVVRELAAVEISSVVDLDVVAKVSGVPRERLARMDGGSHLALGVVGTLAAEVGRERLRGAGIVLGSVMATIDLNALYFSTIRTRGAAFAEGRKFAYTTPNAAAGECAIAFGLTGPNVCVGSGLAVADEAREVAGDLLRSGLAKTVVVVVVDAVGPVARRVADLGRWDVKFGGRAMLLTVD